ncbi:MAG: hypothetical protein FD135_5287 [Comamonadaceae bacterium]|nr:MAG: hypothetical protein FD135_5287 [Comamonadaceae bacterium]
MSDRLNHIARAIATQFRRATRRLTSLMGAVSCVGMLTALWLSLICQASLAQPMPPLDESLNRAIHEIATKQAVDVREFQALLQEFVAMLNTNESRVAQFVPRVATPERVDRLFRMPEVARLPKTVRENGLIFAGQAGSTLMTFDKPSDVVAKVSFWFPAEMDSARSRDDRLAINLYGPFKNWAVEPATFMALWNCMPTEVWLDPKANPFRNRLGKPKFMSIRGNGSQDTDFGECVRARNGYYGVYTNEEAAQLAEQLRLMAGRVVPHLQNKFANFLQTNRCRGSGPDDCVLLLHLWASLTADDPRLARMLQSLETDVALNAPLPAMKMPFDGSNPHFEAGAERFDAVWRRAAFLRAKLRSILSGSDAWPKEALRESIGQIIVLQKLLEGPYASRFDYADLDYRAPAISPWRVLYTELRVRETGPNGLPPEILEWVPRPRDGVTLRRVRAAVLEALSDMEGIADCRVVKPWLTPELATEYALSRLGISRDGSAPSCAQPDWPWLKAGASEAAVLERTRYLDYLQAANSKSRDEVLSQLANYGDDCFGKQKGSLPDWQQRLCSRWIHEPATVQLTLKNSKLRLDKSRQFRQFVSQAPRDGGNGIADQRAWLSSLAQGMPGQASTHLAAYAKELQDKGQVIDVVNLWRHPGHSRALFELHMAGGDCATVLLLLTPHGVQKVFVPPRISQRSVCHTDIVRVSDLDQDGRLEVWWTPESWGATRFDACTGDDGDLRRNLDCSAIDQPAEMAEIDGAALTYFVNNRQSRSETPTEEVWTSSENLYQFAKSPDIQVVGLTPACNRILVGSVLYQKLGIAEWSENASAGREVMELACARHPIHPDQTIVALFHELAGATGPNDVYRAGFVVAVIDIQRKRVLSIYRSEIEEDGGTRIRGGGGLRLDTARYHLTPNVRAFGVRMSIAYSPRYAEGGSSDQLTLFVEEGNKLRPVLSDLAMSSWEMLDSNGCFDQPENSELPCVIEDQTRTLALAPSSTNGWRDLELTTMTTQRDSGVPGKRQVEKTLRYLKNKYE